MPYLTFDLDAKARLPIVAGILQTTPGAIAWGLLELWEHAWRIKSDIVGELTIEGCFGPSEKARAALEEHGFIEKAEPGRWRVKGADRYLRIAKARAEGGRKGGKRSAELRQNKQNRSKTQANGKQTASKTEALTSNIEHRASTDLNLAGEHPPAPAEKAKKAKKPADPRLTELTKRLASAYEQTRGEKYAHQGVKDAEGLKRLLPLGTDEAIERKWRAGLVAQGWPRVSNFAQLAQKWGDIPAQALKPTSIEDRQCLAL